MAKFLDKVRALTSVLKYFSIFHLPRWENAWAYALSLLATLADSSLDHTYIKYLEASSINEIEKFQ